MLTTPLPDSAWFTDAGPDTDVVISTRIRLSRNVEGLAFPSNMSDEDQAEFTARLDPLFGTLLAPPRYGVIDLDDVDATTRQVCVERNLLSDSAGRARPFLLVLRDDHRLSLTINGTDHVRIAGFRGGLNAQDALEDVRSLDEEMDASLRFAVDVRFGYLTSDIYSCGTGLGAGVLAQLPGLSASGALDDALRSVLANNFRVKRFRSTDDTGLGSVYQVSNGASFGKSEESIVRELEAVTGQLVQLEREARDTLFSEEKSGLQEQIYAAIERLRCATVLGTEEALNNLLWARVAASLGMLEGVSPESLTPLLFQVQKSHILLSIASEGSASEYPGGGAGITDRMVDAHRAEFVRRSLQEIR